MPCLSRFMIKIKIKKTGIIEEVTRNIAYDLVDRGIAEVVQNEQPKTFTYPNRQMHTSRDGRGDIRIR